MRKMKDEEKKYTKIKESRGK